MRLVLGASRTDRRTGPVTEPGRDVVVVAEGRDAVVRGLLGDELPQLLARVVATEGVAHLRQLVEEAHRGDLLACGGVDVEAQVAVGVAGEHVGGLGAAAAQLLHGEDGAAAEHEGRDDATDHETGAPAGRPGGGGALTRVGEPDPRSAAAGGLPG